MFLASSLGEVGEAGARDAVSGELSQGAQDVPAYLFHMNILHLTNNYNTKILITSKHLLFEFWMPRTPILFSILIINRLMNNKKLNRHIADPESDLEIVYEQIHKNKEEIELFYAKNKMKFPPILQSKNIVCMHLLPEYAEVAILEGQFKNNSKGGHPSPSLQSKNLIQKHPTICNIEFQKAKVKKKSSMDHRKTRSNQFTPNSFRTIHHTPKRYQISEEKSRELKFLNEPYANDQTIQLFFERLNRKKSKDKKNTYIFTKSYEITNESKKRQSEPVSVNKIFTENPEVRLRNTFEGKQKIFETQRVGQRLKIPGNAPPQNTKDGSNIFRRRKVSTRRQTGYFEPWQQESQLEEDYFGDFKR